MCGLTSATVTPLAGKNRRGRACVVPNTGGCAEDDTILPKQHSVCGAEARATLKQSAYCAPESLDACLCLQTLGEALHPKLHCVPPGGTMDPPQTLLGHLQRRCLETARPGRRLAENVAHLQLLESMAVYNNVSCIGSVPYNHRRIEVHHRTTGIPEQIQAHT